MGGPLFFFLSLAVMSRVREGYGCTSQINGSAWSSLDTRIVCLWSQGYALSRHKNGGGTPPPRAAASGTEGHITPHAMVGALGDCRINGTRIEIINDFQRVSNAKIQTNICHEQSSVRQIGIFIFLFLFWEACALTTVSHLGKPKS